MSLVTCVDLGNKISLISDGLMTKVDGDFHGNNFKKFLVRNDFFIAITNSQIVAEVYFNEIEKNDLSAISTLELIGSTFNSLNKEFNIVIGANIGKQYCYNVYTHFENEYESHLNIPHFNNYPLVMNSSNVKEQDVKQFKSSIKALIENKANEDEIISKQIQFHNYISKIDKTVNDEIFHEYYFKV